MYLTSVFVEQTTEGEENLAMGFIVKLWLVIRSRGKSVNKGETKINTEKRRLWRKTLNSSTA